MAPSTFRAFETRKTRWAHTITTSITYPPRPFLREFFSATHTWNKHKQTSIKLIYLDCKGKHFPSNHQGFEGKLFDLISVLLTCRFFIRQMFFIKPCLDSIKGRRISTKRPHGIKHLGIITCAK